MGIHSVSFGPVINIQPEDLIRLHKQLNNPDKEIVVVKYLNDKKKTAYLDNKILEYIGVEIDAITARLASIVVKAKEIYRRQSASREFYSNIVSVSEGNSFFSYCELGVSGVLVQPCSLCEQVSFSPKIIEIRNNRTHDQLRFPELSLHSLLHHKYFGQTQECFRIDPFKLCEVLDLVTVSPGASMA
jgi:hypothetical protein